MLACIYVRTLRNTKVVLDCAGSGAAGAAEVRRTVAAVGAAMALLRALQAMAAAAQAPPALVGIWGELDEYASLAAEQATTNCAQLCDEAQQRTAQQQQAQQQQVQVDADWAAARAEAAAVAQLESAHRADEGYTTQWDASDRSPTTNEARPLHGRQRPAACAGGLLIWR